MTQAATGHWNTITLQDAWDEPVYGTAYVCAVCGASFGDAGSAGSHISSAHGNQGQYYQTTTQTGSIHHDAVTESEWIEDSPASSSSVLSGYKCSKCGKTKGVNEEIDE